MKSSIQLFSMFAFISLIATSHLIAQEANCLASDGTQIYAGIRGVILKTSDQGNSTLSVKIQDPSADKLQINKLAVSGSILVAVSNSENLFLSADRGANWEEVFLVKQDSAVYIDAIATDGTNIFVGANSTLYMSNDSGASWKKNTDITNANIFCIKIIGTTLYAGGNIEEHHPSENEQHKSVLYVSTNKGINWKRMDKGLTETVAEIAVQDTTIYAGTLTLGNNQGGLFRYDKKTSNWRLLKPGSIASLEINGKTIFAVSDNEGVLNSSDGGEHWESRNNGIKKAKKSYHISFLIACQSTIYGISNGYLYLSTDNGEHWVPSKQTKIAKEKNFLYSDFYADCIIGADGKHVLAGGEWGVYEMIANADKKIDVYDNKYFDGTTSFTEKGDGSYNIQAITLKGTGIFAQTKFGWGSIHQSDDNGTSWISVRDKMGVRSTTYGEISEGGTYWHLPHNYLLNTSTKKNKTKVNVTALIRNGNFIFAGSDNGIFRLIKGKDKAATYYGDPTEWANSKVDLKSDSVTSISINGAAMYVGTKHGLFVSNDNGETYSAINLNKSENAIFSLQTNGSNIFAGSKGGVFVSHDTGKTWAFEEDGLAEGLKISTLAISGTTVYALVNNIVFVSFDNGDDWEQAQFNKIFKYPNIQNKKYYADLEKAKALKKEEDRQKAASSGRYQSSGGVFRANISQTYNPNPTPSAVRMWGSQNARYH